jgi:hypothetical protein
MSPKHLRIDLKHWLLNPKRVLIISLFSCKFEQIQRVKFLLLRKDQLNFERLKLEYVKLELPPAMASRYEDAKLAVTIPGIVLLNTSLIIGLATLIRPMPPVQRRAKN